MDRFLALHRVGDDTRLFDLSRRHRSISVRDQMIRAAMMASRLSTWLQSQSYHVNNKVLVIGAGACGVSLSLMLAERGHQVVLCDSLTKLFQLQRGSHQRWIDPAQYDWPLGHYKRGVFPLGEDYERPSDFPLPWSADIASDIVRFQWRPNVVRLWKKSLAKGLIEFRGRTWANLKRVQDAVDDGTGKLAGINIWLMQLAANAAPIEYPEDFAAVVLAGGFGNERTSCPIADRPGFHFFGPPFWCDDGLQSLDASDTIVISGSGDGAMQDLIRVMTGMDSAKQLLEAIGLKKNHPSIHSIASVEHRLERSLAWRHGEIDEQFFEDQYDRLHKRYIGAVKRIHASQNEILPIVTRTTLNSPKRVHVISTTPYLTANYPLNRFLGYMLLMMCHEKIKFHPLRQLKQVAPLVGQTVPSELNVDPQRLGLLKVSDLAGTCAQLRWRVETVPAGHPTSSDVHPIEPVDRLVIRHGLLDARIPELQTAQYKMPKGPDPDPPFLVSP